jgi:hypothetical protein
MPFSISARWRSRRAGSGIFISRSSSPAPACFLSCGPNEIAKLASQIVRHEASPAPRKGRKRRRMNRKDDDYACTNSENSWRSGEFHPDRHPEARGRTRQATDQGGCQFGQPDRHQDPAVVCRSARICLLSLARTWLAWSKRSVTMRSASRLAMKRARDQASQAREKPPHIATSRSVLARPRPTADIEVEAARPLRVQERKRAERSLRVRCDHASR